MLDIDIGMELEGKEVCPMCDGKCGTVADNDATIGGDWSGRGKITRMSKHVSRGSGVHVPIVAASVVCRCRGDMQRGEERRIPRRRGQRRRW